MLLPFSLSLLLGLSLSLSLLLPRVSADSSYCASHGSTSTSYSSCCGISPLAMEYLLASQASAVTGVSYSTSMAANIVPSFSSCPASAAASRCCGWSQAPSLAISAPAPGSSGTTQFGVTSPVVYSMVIPTPYSCVTPSSCCVPADCQARFGDVSRRFDVWSCEAGTCVERVGACPYEPLNFPRSMLLFVLPGVVLAIEMFLWMLPQRRGKLFAFDCTHRGFGVETSLVKVGVVLLRIRTFHVLVVANLAFAVGSHLWQALRAPDGCATAGAGLWLEWVYAMGYVVFAGIAWIYRSASAREAQRFQDVWIDLMLAINCAHVAALITAAAVGPLGRSWLDYLILAHQAFGARWIVFAVPLFPFTLCWSPGTGRVRPLYTAWYRLVDAQWWQAGASYFDRDDELATHVPGYNRRKVGWDARASLEYGNLANQSSAVIQSGAAVSDSSAVVVFSATTRKMHVITALHHWRASGDDVHRARIAELLAAEQDFIAHYNPEGRCDPHACWARSIVVATIPEYRIDGVTMPGRPIYAVPELAVRVHPPTPSAPAADPALGSNNYLNPSLDAPQFFSALDTPLRAKELARAESIKRARSVARQASTPGNMPRTPSPGRSFQSPSQQQKSQVEMQLMSPQQKVFKAALYDSAPASPRDLSDTEEGTEESSRHDKAAAAAAETEADDTTGTATASVAEPSRFSMRGLSTVHAPLLDDDLDDPSASHPFRTPRQASRPASAKHTRFEEDAAASQPTVARSPSASPTRSALRPARPLVFDDADADEAKEREDRPEQPVRLDSTMERKRPTPLRLESTVDLTPAPAPAAAAAVAAAPAPVTPARPLPVFEQLQPTLAPVGRFAGGPLAPHLDLPPLPHSVPSPSSSAADATAAPDPAATASQPSYPAPQPGPRSRVEGGSYVPAASSSSLPPLPGPRQLPALQFESGLATMSAVKDDRTPREG